MINFSGIYTTMEFIKKAGFFMTTLIVIMAFKSSVVAQNVDFKVTAPRVVEAGEQFRLSYSVNTKGSSFQAPSFKGFSVLTGPNVSSSSSVQIINGKVSQTATYTYNYILVAYEAGKFTIPAAKIKAKGKVHSSNVITVEVVKGQKSQAAKGNGSSNKNVQAGSNKDIFAAVNVDRKSVYQGEKIITTIKIYTRLDIGGFKDYKFPPYSGFWSQDIESPTQLSFQRENVNGAIYNVALLKKSLIVPQRSGDLVIDPFTATVQVRERVRSNNPFDDFFGGSYRNKAISIASKPIKIKVKPLPANKPSGYEGAVGQLKLSSSIDKTKVKANEAITLKIRIAGNGNLKFITAPKVDFPPDIELYDPKKTINTKVSEQGVAGNVTFDYLFIPRYAGTYRIAPVNFSYFDLSTKKYKTVQTKEYEIVVEKGEGTQEMSSGVVQGFTKEDVQLLGKDIRFIKTDFKVNKRQGTLYGSQLFWAVYIISLVVFIALLLIRRTQIAQNANQAKVKNRKANKLSKKRLRVASGYMKQNNQEQFYDEVLKAVWGYLSDKLSIPVADLSKDNVNEILSKHQVDEEGVKQLMELIDACEFARYAPAAVTGGMDDIFKKAGDLLSKLDQKIK